MTVSASPPATRLERAIGNLIGLGFLYPERFSSEVFADVPPAAAKAVKSPLLLTAVELSTADATKHGRMDRNRIMKAANGDGARLGELLADLVNDARPDEPKAVLFEIAAALDEIEKAKAAQAEVAAPTPVADIKPEPSPDPKITILENMKPRPVLDLLQDDTLTSPEEVFEGLLALGEVTVLGGPPKAMKSWTVKAMGLCAAAGAPWLGFPAKRPFKVLLLSAEGREVRLRERYQKLIAFTPIEEDGLRRMEYLSTGGRLKIDTDAGEATLIRLVEPFEVVILDPMYRFVSVGDENSHRDQRLMQDVLDRVKGLGKCVIVVHHVRKATGINTGISELRGAGLDGYVDGAIMLSRTKEDSDEKFRLDFTLRNFEDPPSMDLTREGVILVPAVKVIRPRVNVTTREIVQILTDFGGEMVGKQLYRQIRELKNVSQATAERALAYAMLPPDPAVQSRPAGGRGGGRIYSLTGVPIPEPVAVQGDLVPEPPKRRRKGTPK